MKILPVVAVIIFSVSAIANTSYAQQTYAINIHREKPIYFSNDKVPDILVVDAVGSKPFNSVFLITIRRAGIDYPLFTDSVVVKKTTATHWESFNIGDLSNLLTALLSKSLRKSAELPSWDQLNEEGLFCDSAEICPKIDQDNYARVRSSGRPLFCYAVGYEYIKCAWFDDKLGFARIVTEISW